MNLIFDNQLSIFEDIFYKYLTPKQCIKLYSSNLILYNIYLTNNKFEYYYFTPKYPTDLQKVVDEWCNNKDKAILKYGHISYWNTTYIYSMAYLFKHKRYFNDNISEWNTSNVNNMEHMFYSAQQFNQYIGNWNVSNVENMRYMFYNTYEFNQELNNWDITNVRDISFMFYYALKFNNEPNWNIDDISCNTTLIYVGSGIK